MPLDMDIHRNVGDIKKRKLMRPVRKTLRCRGSMELRLPTTGTAKKGLFSALPKLRARRPLELSTVRLMVWRPTRFSKLTKARHRGDILHGDCPSSKLSRENPFFDGNTRFLSPAEELDIENLGN